MKRFIDAYLKSKKIKTILERKRITDAVNIEIINFLGCDNRYYSLLLGYNDSEVFVNNQNVVYSNLLGESRSKVDLFFKIDRNLRVFDNHEDWVKNRYKRFDMNNFNLFIKKSFYEKFNKFLGKAYGNFVVVDVKFSLMQVSTLSILYTYKGYPQESLNILLNGKVIIKNPFNDVQAQEEFVEFIKQIALDNCIEVVTDVMTVF